MFRFGCCKYKWLIQFRRILEAEKQSVCDQKLAKLTRIVLGFWLAIFAIADGAWAKSESAEVDARGGGGLTDLQLFSRALQDVVRDVLDELPAEAGGSGIVLLPDEPQAQNWIAEDALAREALRRRIPVVLKRPEGNEGAWRLYYRMVDPQVVYEPHKPKLLPFGRQVRRVARGAIFLRLENQGGGIGWVRKREIRMEAAPFEEGSADLASSALVDQTTVPVDNRIVEFGLSTALVGGLFYIFFIL
jgi:hypothetical protein